MRHDTFPLAFGLSAAAVFFTVAGSRGYTFSRQVGHYQGHWTGAPVMWEVAAGVACAVVAALAWRSAFRSVTEGKDAPRRPNTPWWMKRMDALNLIVLGVIIVFILWTSFR